MPTPNQICEVVRIRFAQKAFLWNLVKTLTIGYNLFKMNVFIFLLFLVSCGGSNRTGFYAISSTFEDGTGPGHVGIYSINILNDSTIVTGVDGKENVVHYRFENNFLLSTENDHKNEILGEFVANGIKVSDIGTFIKTTPELAKSDAETKNARYYAEWKRISDSIYEADRKQKLMEDQWQKSADSIAKIQQELLKKNNR